MPSNATSRLTESEGDLDPIVAQIWHALAGLGDPDRARGQQAYMKSDLPFRGLTSPELKATLRPLLAGWQPTTRSAWEGAIRALWFQVAFREEWYAALALLRHRGARQWLDADVLPLLGDLISAGAWWDVVDDIATHPLRDALAVDPARVAPTLREWSQHADLWRRRAAVLAQIGRKEQTDRALLVDLIEVNLADPSFWLRKAIGWALRDYARHDPAWVLERVTGWDTALSGLSRREALKHIR